MDRKKLIVSGCSFTIGHHLGEKGSWAYYLNNMLGTELHNLARGGMGNSYISNSIIGHFIKNPELIPESTVMVAWSEITRGLGTFTNPIKGHTELVTIRPQDFIKDDSKSHWPLNEDEYHGYTIKHANVVLPYFSSWNFRVYETYLAMLHLKTFLELHKRPYIFFDAVGNNKVTINKNHNKLILDTGRGETISLDESIETFMASIINNKVITYLFEDPNRISFNGCSMNDYMYLDSTTSHMYTVGNGGHPNEYASEHFAKMILKEYERLYNKR